MFLEEGVADQKTLTELEAEQGLGVFLRSLTGMNRSSAKAAFSTFTTDHKLNGNQTEFLNLVIDYLTDSGIVEPKRFYESPFTDFDDQGIAGVFQMEQAALIIKIVSELNEAAAA
jgi:type I restriction enzyme R subunit